jgi:hypothetical protein
MKFIIHSVVGVLGPAKTRLHNRKACLHEHDQEARDQCPGEVDGDLVLANLVEDVRDRQTFLGIANGDISHRTGERTIRIAFEPDLWLGRIDVLEVFGCDSTRRCGWSRGRLRRCYRCHKSESSQY